MPSKGFIFSNSRSSKFNLCVNIPPDETPKRRGKAEKKTAKSMSIYRNTLFFLKGMSEFSKSGYEKASAKFNPGELDVDLKGKVFLVTGASRYLIFFLFLFFISICSFSLFFFFFFFVSFVFFCFVRFLIASFLSKWIGKMCGHGSCKKR